MSILLFLSTQLYPLYISYFYITLSLLSVSPLFSASSPPLCLSSSLSIPLSLHPCLFPSVYTHMSLISVSSLFLSPSLSLLSLSPLFLILFSPLCAFDLLTLSLCLFSFISSFVSPFYLSPLSLSLSLYLPVYLKNNNFRVNRLNEKVRDNREITIIVQTKKVAIIAIIISDRKR
jgi:hypothetical protein